MLGTIVIGTCVSVQGEIVHRLPDGRMSVKVGDQMFTGRAANPDAGLPRPMARKDHIRAVV